MAKVIRFPTERRNTGYQPPLETMLTYNASQTEISDTLYHSKTTASLRLYQIDPIVGELEDTVNQAHYEAKEEVAKAIREQGTAVLAKKETASEKQGGYKDKYGSTYYDEAKQRQKQKVGPIPPQEQGELPRDSFPYQRPLTLLKTTPYESASENNDNTLKAHGPKDARTMSASNSTKAIQTAQEKTLGHAAGLYKKAA